jgi:hypothetical protein
MTVQHRKSSLLAEATVTGGSLDCYDRRADQWASVRFRNCAGRPGHGCRNGHSTGLSTESNHRDHVLTWDFIADAAVPGRGLRRLTKLDEFTRKHPVGRIPFN